MVATGKNFLREKKRTSAHGTCIVARPPLQQGGTRKRNTKYRITCCGIPGPFTEDSRVHAIAVYLFRIYQNAYVHTPFESPAANRAAQHQSHRHSWIVSIRESDSGSMGTHRPPCINTGDTLGQTQKGHRPFLPGQPPTQPTTPFSRLFRDMIVASVFAPLFPSRDLKVKPRLGTFGVTASISPLGKQRTCHSSLWFNRPKIYILCDALRNVTRSQSRQTVPAPRVFRGHLTRAQLRERTTFFLVLSLLPPTR